LRVEYRPLFSHEITISFSSQSAIAIENARLFSAVSKEKEKLGTVFSEMSDGVIFLDESAKIVIVNPVVENYTGQSPNDLIGKNFGPDIFGNFEITPSIEDVKKFKDDVTTVSFKRKSEKELFLSAQIHRLVSPSDKNVYGYLVILRDVTEDVRGEKLKRNFLSLVSHKLKTPLTVIVGYAPSLLLKSEALNESQIKGLKAIQAQSEQMAGLVDKLLRYTIVESESIGKNASSQSVEPLLQEAIKELSGLIKETKAQIRIDPKLKDQPKVFVDGPLTVELLKNLIENAIKFNEKKEKEIVISCENSGRYSTLNLFDNGPGIPPEEQSKIFQKFHQIENSFTGHRSGSGRGLGIGLL